MPSKYSNLHNYLRKINGDNALPQRVAEVELLAFSLYSILGRNEVSLVVCPNVARIDFIREDLNLLMKISGDKRPLLIFPELLNGRDDFQPETESARDIVLQQLLKGEDCIVLTTPLALVAEVLTPESLRNSQRDIVRGDEGLEPESLCEVLVAMDYDNELQVNMPGEFSRRGGVVDIFSPIYNTAFRIEFFGDEIDSIRSFDPETQLSTEEVERFTLTPCSGAQLQRGSLLLYFDSPNLVFLDKGELDKHVETYFEEATLDSWKSFCEVDYRAVTVDVGADFSDFPVKALAPYYKSCLPEIAEGYQGLHQQFLEQQLIGWQERHYEIFAFCGGAANSKRFRELFTESAGVDLSRICVLNLELQCGFMLPRDGAVFLSESEIFGRAAKREVGKKPRYSLQAILEAEPNFSVGDAVVHENYGIALFQGIRLEGDEGLLTEVLELEFADDRSLLIPLDNIHLISRYIGSGGGKPKLSRLTGSVWKKSCEKAENAAKDFASEILRLQAMRRACQVQAFGPDTEWQVNFEESFPYEETADQLQAIKEIKKDLESMQPMDRLLCGDVGFGKTEVAMRAAFKAVMEGRQVAIVVPTTVLAQQHGQTFSARMADYPVRIEVLSRMVTKRQQKLTLEAVALGQVDIVIGTHRLLQEDVVFENLGLAVIDEEQRFGVTAKEKLKRLRATVDILTMTATPIPRTLHMSLSGLRDLSTIMTPPRERKPVRTEVVRYDRTIIRKAIMQELERGGQVYYLHNRVQTIEETCLSLKALVPEARFAFGHGQMKEGSLESVMTGFVEGKVDVFVCTTIVESGLDVPNANTMIIERSDMFGLSELYQLRGRVGRYHYQAFCYLLLPVSGVVLEAARARLSALRRYTHLGSGFKLALRDLEIRGAGNIIGAEQSGYIASVGFELYCQLLKDATARLENKPSTQRKEVSVKIDFLSHSVEDKKGISACLPESYIPSENIRLEFYRRLSLLKSGGEDLEAVRSELRDRFGRLPQEVHWYLKIVQLKLRALELGIVSIRVQRGRVFIETPRGLWRVDGSVPELDNGSPELMVRQLGLLLEDCYLYIK